MDNQLASLWEYIKTNWWVGFAVAGILVVWQYRMTATWANITVALSWVVFLFAIFRAPVVCDQATIPRVLYTVLVGSMLGLFFYYTLWTPRDSSERVLQGTIANQEPMPNRAAIPTLEIGTGGARLVFTHGLSTPGEERIRFLYDAGLRIDAGPNGLEISTPIRDRTGKKIADIDHNHWRVSPDCWDNNFSKDALEVLDQGGHVVFQARILADRVQVQGEWRDQFGSGARLITAPGGGEIVVWRNHAEEQQSLQLIEPMFRYPSKDHLGELAKPR